METEIKSENRGGARVGAGRKKKYTDDNPRKVMPITFEAYQALDGIKNKTEYVSNLILKDAAERKLVGVN